MFQVVVIQHQYSAACILLKIEDDDNLRKFLDSQIPLCQLENNQMKSLFLFWMLQKEF